MPIRPVRILCPSPGCPTELLAIDAVADRRIACARCGGTIAMENRVVDLMGPPGVAMPKSRGQQLMERPSVVRVYESRLWRRSPLLVPFMGITFEQESKLVLRAARLTGNEVVLDLGCGTGNHARRFARRVPSGTVVGLDMSAPMLAQAGQRAKAERLDNLFFVRASAQRLPFPDEEFDVVNCCGAMHLFSPLERALSEIRRVLKPGGRLTVATVRAPLGERAHRFARRGERRFGVHAFAPGELERAWAEAGLTEIVTYHAYRYWTVMGATRPPSGGVEVVPAKVA